MSQPSTSQPSMSQLMKDLKEDFKKANGHCYQEEIIQVNRG